LQPVPIELSAMKASILRKIVIVLIFFAPVVSYTGCKKQAKCGCGKDILFTLTNSRAHVYFNDTKSSVYFQLSSDMYSTYYFCNPSQWKDVLANYKTGDELLVSGHCYWECSYLYQASNSYYSYYKAYMVDITNVYMDMYGK
jgi:hypothetical protein